MSLAFQKFTFGVPSTVNPLMAFAADRDNLVDVKSAFRETDPRAQVVCLQFFPAAWSASAPAAMKMVAGQNCFTNLMPAVSPVDPLSFWRNPALPVGVLWTEFSIHRIIFSGRPPVLHGPRL